MARVPLIDPAEMSEENARAVQRSGSLNVFRAVANSPDLLRPWMRLGHRLLTETELSPRMRELVILHVGTTMRCEYEIAQHAEIALREGAASDEISAVLAGRVDGFAPDDRRILELVGSSVRDGRAGEAEVDAVREILGDRALVELMLVTAHYMGLAALLNVLDIDVDEEGRLQLSSSR